MKEDATFCRPHIHQKMLSSRQNLLKENESFIPGQEGCTKKKNKKKHDTTENHRAGGIQ